MAPVDDEGSRKTSGVRLYEHGLETRASTRCCKCRHVFTTAIDSILRWPCEHSNLSIEKPGEIKEVEQERIRRDRSPVELSTVYRRRKSHGTFYANGWVISAISLGISLGMLVWQARSCLVLPALELLASTSRIIRAPLSIRCHRSHPAPPGWIEGADVPTWAPRRILERCASPPRRMPKLTQFPP